MAYRVLVTGAAGFMGSHVAEACLDRGMEVVAVDDLSGGYHDNVPDEANFVEGDLRDADFVASLWEEHGPFRFVYHLAAYAAEGLSHFIRVWNYRTNLEASVNLINQAILNDVERFVFTSSIAVYGSNQVPMREDMVPLPMDPYGVSKWAVELDLAAANDMFGLDYTIFRPHNVYGERQNIADPYRNVIGIFMNNVIREQPMPVVGDGLQTRAFTHIADVAPVISEAPFVKAAANETFNVGADTPYTILDLVQEVARAFGVEPDVTHLPMRKEVVHAFSDHSKVREAFSSPEPVELSEGIGRMARWVKEVGSREPHRFQGASEVNRNLPPNWGRSRTT
jgi:UDP-glucose 4-epimerase